jgi:hypothetical protein
MLYGNWPTSDAAPNLQNPIDNFGDKKKKCDNFVPEL